MSPFAPKRRARDIGFPRVSGDEPGYRESSRTVGGFSPRERG